MKTVSVTRHEVASSKDCKLIFQNILIFILLYVIGFAASYGILWLWNPTTGAILMAIFSILAVFILTYQVIRLVRIVNGYNKFPCSIVKLDKVNYYMGERFPVFAAAIKTSEGTKVVETNAIYKKKDLPFLQNHKAKVLYDAKKNRIYIITLVD